MNISNNVLKHYLKNVYFITGTAYSGKSTAAKMLSEKYDMVFCGENYHYNITNQVADPQIQPDLCYMKTMKDWKEIKAMKATSPKQYGQYLQQKKRGNGKRKKRVKGK